MKASLDKEDVRTLTRLLAAVSQSNQFCTDDKKYAVKCYGVLTAITGSGGICMRPRDSAGNEVRSIP